MEVNSAKSNFGKKGWLIILFVFFLYWFSSTPPDTLNVTAMMFADKLGLETSNSLLVFSAVGGFVGILFSLIFGLIVAKVGVKWPTFVILVIYAATWFLNGAVNSFMMYAVVVTLITAISNTINLVSTQQIMSNWFPRKKGIALGWATMGMCFDGAIMVAVFQALITNKGLSAPFNLMVVISLIMAIITAIAFKAYPEQAGAYPDNEKISEEEKQKNLAMIMNYKSEWTSKRLLKNKEFWSIVLIFGFLFVGLVGTFSQMIPRLLVVGMSINGAILCVTIAAVIGIPGSYLWGFIDQKIGTKKTVEVFCGVWLLTMVISVVGAAISNLQISVVAVVLFACLIGGLGNLFPSMIIQVYGRYDFAQANKLIIPFVVGIRSIALIVVPMMLAIAGIGNEAVGFRNIFIVFSVISLISLILAIRLKGKTIGKTL